jgi:polyisoprenoid-binding protein YceI
MTMASGDKDGVGNVADPTSHLINGAWAGDWVLDPSRSSVGFRSTSLWGLVKVKGTFSSVRGEGSLGSDGEVTGRVVIDATSVDTGKAKRDNHLRSDDFFHAATHPEITYAVSAITPVGAGRVRVTGDLTILDQTRPLELNATLEEADADAATVVTTGELDRSAWGISFKKMGMTKMATGIEARLRFTRPT